MNIDDVTTLLRRHKSELRQRFGVSRLAVFGSVARGSDREGSDIDILVEFDRAPGFDAFMDLKYYLEDLLGVPVDLVTRKALRPRIRKHVEREAIDVA